MSFYANNQLLFSPTDSQTLLLLDNSELLSIVGDPDLELELFTPYCLDRAPSPLFTILSPNSSPVSPILGPASSIEQFKNQTQPTINAVPVSPTTNALLNNSLPSPSCYPESKDELQQPSFSSKRDVRPLLQHPRHIRSQSQADITTLHRQHKRE